MLADCLGRAAVNRLPAAVLRFLRHGILDRIRLFILVPIENRRAIVYTEPTCYTEILVDLNFHAIHLPPIMPPEGGLLQDRDKAIAPRDTKGSRMSMDGFRKYVMNRRPLCRCAVLTHLALKPRKTKRAFEIRVERGLDSWVTITIIAGIVKKIPMMCPSGMMPAMECRHHRHHHHSHERERYCCMPMPCPGSMPMPMPYRGMSPGMPMM